MNSLHLSDDQKRELKTMMSKYAVAYSNDILEMADNLKVIDEIDEDTSLRTYEAKCYKKTMDLCLHFYNPDIIIYDLKKDFWNNDTSIREYIWDALKKYLSAELFETIHEYMIQHNHP